MGGSTLKVSMFGGFRLNYEGQDISFERNTATKTNQLMQILLLAGKEGIKREHLMAMLFGRDELTNPANSLRATVFRLRKLLAETNLPEDDYIHIKKGIYTWTSAIPYELDVNRFFNLRDAVAEEKDSEKAQQLRREALDLYRGELLPSISMEEWVIVKSVAVKEVYTVFLTDFVEKDFEEERYDDALQYLKTAVKLYPFQDWQSYQVQGLMELGRMEEAMQVYENTSKLYFEELGISPSERMLRQIQKISDKFQTGDGVAEDINRNLKEKEVASGALFCSYPNFVNSYRYMERVLERTGLSAYLLVCTMVNGRGEPLKKTEKQLEMAERLRDAIQTSLRKGDMFTQYSPNQYLLLLLSIKQEDCKVVMGRIENTFAAMGRRCDIRFSAFALADVKESDGTFHFDSMKEAWK